MATTLAGAHISAQSTTSDKSISAKVRFFSLAAWALLGFLGILSPDAAAYSNSPTSISGLTLKSGSSTGCSGCHGAADIPNSPPGNIGITVAITGPGSPPYALSASQSATFTVTATKSGLASGVMGVAVAATDTTSLSVFGTEPTTLYLGEIIHNSAAGNGPLKTVSGGTANYKFTFTMPAGATAGSSKTIYALAALGVSRAPWNHATSISVYVPPAVPASLTPSGQTTTSVNLAWTGGGPEYRLVFKAGAVAPTDPTDGTATIVDLGTSTSTTVSGLSQTTQYSFAVFSKIAGVSVFSTTARTATATTTTVMGARYVNAATGSNTTDCRTQATPCKTITYAMTQAAPGTPGDPINVAPGTYNVASGEVFPIAMTSGVQLQATGTAAATIIDATGSNTRLFNAIGSNASTVIQGLTIMGGFNVGPADGTNVGGGAILIGSLAQINIRRNIFTGNEARGYGGVAPSYSKEGYGGAIYSSGSPTIENNVFSTNTASGGDGVGGTTGGAAGSGHGGAIWGGAAIVVNNTFYNNVARGGSGGSSSSGQGGAGGQAFSSAVETNNTSVVNNNFANNSSIGGTGGSGSTPGSAGNAIGGALGATSSPSNTNNLFFGNTSNGDTGTSSVLLDPQFLSAPTNLRIGLGSPARAAGTATGAPAIDLDGTSRPTPPSIGAFEASSLVVGPRYVNAATGSDTGTCITQASPCKTITYAMDQAAAGAPGDAVNAAPGTYNTTSGEVFPITVKSGVQLKSTGTAANTFIDATGANKRVLVATSTNSSTVIEGFTITGGLFQPSNDGSIAKGAGLFIDGGSPTVRKNIFLSNEARGYAGGGSTFVSGGEAYGGAINAQSATPTIVNNVFRGNIARGGTGKSSLGSGVAGSSGGRGQGGAIYLSSGGSINNNTFYGNSAIGGNGGSTEAALSGGTGGNASQGALISFGASVNNNIFAGNSATAGVGGSGTPGGGAGSADYGAMQYNSPPADASNNLFYGNLVNGAASTGDTIGTNSQCFLSPGCASVLFQSEPTNLRILPTSPGAGTGTTTGAPTDDFDGVTRANPPSIGAFEASNVKVASTTALASGTNPSTSGQSVIFTATASGSSGTATGTVTFKDGTTAICSGVALASGQAQCSTSSLSAGTHSMTAEYSGDSVYFASTSSALSQVVQTPPGSFALSVTNAGTGGGTVTSSPAGINCGATCVANFTSGTSVTLSAVASSGSVFAGWSGGGCSGTGGCTVSMTAATSVTATFTALTVFNVVISGAQEVPPNAISASGSGTATVNPVANTITYSFSVTGLSGAIAGAHFHGPAARGVDGGVKIDIGSNPFSGTVNYNQSDEADILGGLWYVNYHTASFPGGEVRGQLDNGGGTATFALTVNTADGGAGTITSSPAGINCGSTCVASFNSGTSVTLSAVAATGSTFAGWSGAGCSGTGTCTVTMTAAATVTASFLPYTGTLRTRYRLYSPGTFEHLYTTDFNEYSVLPVCCAWVAEGAIYRLFSGAGSYGGVTAVPYYRLYNPFSFQHHWTTDAGEYNFLPSVGWQQEGTDGYILPTQASGLLPLYRLYLNAAGGLHLWTIDVNERNYLVANAGWVDEGIAGYVIPLP